MAWRNYAAGISVRFAGIHVSIQLWAKTQWWVTLGENLGKKGLTAVNLD